MQKLHLVGVTTDHKGLILSARRGARTGSFQITVDEELAESVEELRAKQAEAEAERIEEEEAARPARVESALSVKEIQARLRQGRTVADVAKAAGMDVAWIDRFAAPVFAERAQVIATVQRSRLRRARLGPSAQSIAEAIRRNLADRGASVSPEEFADGWTARQLADGRWAVRFRYRHRGRDHVLRFDVDDAGANVVAADRPSGQVGYVAPATPPRPTRSRPASASGNEGGAAKRATVTVGFRPDEAAGTATSRAAKERERANEAMRKAAAKAVEEAERAAARRVKEREAELVRRKRAAEAEEARKARERAAAERAKAAAAKRQAAAARKRAAERAKAKAAKQAADQARRAEAALRAAERKAAASKKAAARKATPAKPKPKPKPAKVTAKAKATPAKVKAKAKATPAKVKAKAKAKAKATPAKAKATPAKAKATPAKATAVPKERASQPAPPPLQERVLEPTPVPSTPVIAVEPVAAARPSVTVPDDDGTSAVRILGPAPRPAASAASSTPSFRVGTVEAADAPTDSYPPIDPWADVPNPGNGMARERPPGERRTRPLRAT